MQVSKGFLASVHDQRKEGSPVPFASDSMRDACLLMTASEPRRGTLRLALRLATLLAGCTAAVGEVEVEEEATSSPESLASIVADSSSRAEDGTTGAAWCSCCRSNEVLVEGTETAMDVRLAFSDSIFTGVSTPFVGLFSLSDGRT